MDENQIDEPLLPVEGKGRAELLELYTWTFDDAMRAHEVWEKNKRDHRTFAVGPLYRWVAAQELKELYLLYQSGNTKAMIEGLYLCSLRDLPIPQWCAMAFIGAVREIKHFKSISWDKALGKPFPKGTHLNAKEKRFKKAPLVYNEIRKIKDTDPSTPIEAGLFEKVGKKYGISKTLCEEYYYDIKKYVEVFK